MRARRVEDHALSLFGIPLSRGRHARRLVLGLTASAPAGAELDALPLLYYRARYPGCAGPDIGLGGQVVSCDFPDYSMSDDWSGAGFVSDGNRHVILILGLKASTNCYCCDPAEPDPECPVSPAPEECRRWCNESSGYHGGPYRRQVLFYDIDELAAVAVGSREPWSMFGEYPKLSLTRHLPCFVPRSAPNVAPT